MISQMKQIMFECGVSFILVFGWVRNEAVKAGISDSLGHIKQA